VFQESVPQVPDLIIRDIYKLHCVRVAFLDALCEVSKRNVSCVMSVCLIVRTEQLLDCGWVDFQERLILRLFTKLCRKNLILMKVGLKKTGTLHQYKCKCIIFC